MDGDDSWDGGCGAGADGGLGFLVEVGVCFLLVADAGVGGDVVEDGGLAGGSLAPSDEGAEFDECA